MTKCPGILVPGKRLAAAAELAAAPLFLGEIYPTRAIDVGCDHARLAVYLVQKGYCSHVLATDISTGPCEKAILNIKNRTLKGESLLPYIDVLQTNGLTELEDFPCERIFICGMGGEVIVDIIKNASFLKDINKKIKLILQPQSCAFELRKYLYENCFNIIEEEIIEDKGFIYSIMSVVFDGISRTKKLSVLYLGEINIRKKEKNFIRLLNTQVKSTFLRMTAKKNANLNFSDDEILYFELNELKKEIELNGDN